MIKENIHFSSKSNEWSTPQDFFDQLNKEFKFTLDPCATPENAKCKKFFTEKDNGLAKSWDGEIVFCNPPYGRAISKWVEKASKARGGGRGLTCSGSHRYEILPRFYLSQSGDPIYQRQTQIRGTSKFSTFSEYGRNLQK